MLLNLLPILYIQSSHSWNQHPNMVLISHPEIFWAPPLPTKQLEQSKKKKKDLNFMTSINSLTSESSWPAQFPYFRDWTHTAACRGRWAATRVAAEALDKPNYGRSAGVLSMPQLPPVEELKKPCAREKISEAMERVPSSPPSHWKYF